MAGGAWRGAVLGLAMAGMALAYLGVEIGRLAGDDRKAYYTDMAAVGLGVLALWVAFTRLNRHFRDLGRLRDDLSTARGRAALGTDARDDEAGQASVGGQDDDRVVRALRGG